MVMLKFVSFSFPQKPIWLQETGVAAASAARGFHWIKVTRSLAVVATLPLKMPWTTIRATLLPFSAASGRRNDCTQQSYASRARIKLDNWANAFIETRFDRICCSHLNSWHHIGLVRLSYHIISYHIISFRRTYHISHIIEAQSWKHFVSNLQWTFECLSFCRVTKAAPSQDWFRGAWSWKFTA